VRPGSGEFTRVFGTVPGAASLAAPIDSFRILVLSSSSRRTRPGQGISFGFVYFAKSAGEIGGIGDRPPRGGGTALVARDGRDEEDCIGPGWGSCDGIWPVAGLL
jgi:hypothetical protein